VRRVQTFCDRGPDVLRGHVGLKVLEANGSGSGKEEGAKEMNTVERISHRDDGGKRERSVKFYDHTRIKKVFG